MSVEYPKSLLISKNYTSSIVFPVWAVLIELIFRIAPTLSIICRLDASGVFIIHYQLLKIIIFNLNSSVLLAQLGNIFQYLPSLAG